MPPQSPIPNPNEDRLLPPGHKSSAGPVVGIIMILAILIVGALYFWGAHLNQQQQNPPPYIPAENSTTTID